MFVSAKNVWLLIISNIILISYCHSSQFGLLLQITSFTAVALEVGSENMYLQHPNPSHIPISMNI